MNLQKTKQYLVPLTFGVFTMVALSAFADGRHHGPKVRESVEVSDLFAWGSTDKVNGAVTLIRDFRGRAVNVTVTTSAAAPDSANSIWVAVFNFPRFCIVAYRCSTMDIGSDERDPRAQPSVFWGGGFLADSYGNANTSFRLVPGRTKREVFAGSDAGLINLRGAEIHVVLRTHGPAGVAGPVADQIGTAAEACPMSGCVNEFFSLHPPRE
ncbi:MAG: hypothetical protein OES38_01925 [Gammaproteobacteria bacterium]|nr:hypothetical protein [Gammaproteobacteria bacterium]